MLLVFPERSYLDDSTFWSEDLLTKIFRNIRKTYKKQISLFPFFQRVYKNMIKEHLSLYADLIKRIFQTDSPFSTTALKGDNQSEEESYNLFIDEFLGDIGSHIEWYYEKKYSIVALEEFIKQLEKIISTFEEFHKTRKDTFFILDVYCPANKATLVLGFKDKYRTEIESILKCSCLEYKFDRDYESMIEKAREDIEEIEQENKIDPYSYYGVSRKDF